MDFNMLGQVNRQLPDADLEHVYEPVRITRYNEVCDSVYVQTFHNLSDEGSYYTATNPTPGTGILAAINASPSETAGNFIHIKNNDSIANVPNGKRLYLDYIKLICTVAPASNTGMQGYIRLDNVNRYTSGGTQITPVNPNMDSATNSIALFYAGALTTVAQSGSSRLINRAGIRTVAVPVGDVTILKFGCLESNGNGSILSTATAIRQTIPCSPVIIGAQQNLSLQLWWPSNATTGGQFEFECGWWER